MKNEKPFEFYSIISGVLFFIAASLFLPIFFEFIDTGIVMKLPTLVVAVGLFLSSLLSLFLGILQNSITYSRREFKRLYYLSIPLTHSKNDGVE
jgi:hypothetical protein